MQKKEFLLTDDDFNRIVEISSNEHELIQIVNKKTVRLSTLQRVRRFWDSIAPAYGFIPDGMETNLPNRDPRYFLAVPVEKPHPHYCNLCKSVSDPDIHSGCDRSAEPGCNWHNIKK